MTREISRHLGLEAVDTIKNTNWNCNRQINCLVTRLEMWDLPAPQDHQQHYNDVIMGVMASQITSLTIVYSTVYSGADQTKHQRSTSLAFVRGIRRWPVNSPHNWPVTRKRFPFDDVISSHGIDCMINASFSTMLEKKCQLLSAEKFIRKYIFVFRHTMQNVKTQFSLIGHF